MGCDNEDEFNDVCRGFISDGECDCNMSFYDYDEIVKEFWHNDFDFRKLVNKIGLDLCKDIIDDEINKHL